MFENGKWQPLRPHEPANQGQRRVGLTEFHFGPEIAFAHEIAKVWPDETIGIIKFSIGGTSVLAWKPDWSKKDADRVGQGRHGSLYKRLMQKVEQAKKSRDIEILGVRPACAMGLTAEFVFNRLDVDEDKIVTVKEFPASRRLMKPLDELTRMGAVNFRGKSSRRRTRKDTPTANPRSQSKACGLTEEAMPPCSLGSSCCEMTVTARWTSRSAVPVNHSIQCSSGRGVLLFAS
ncbi:MAG: sialate O-acetylesterase [Planctomycetota bacterium]